MAEALYRKYRPQVFSDVVGQDHIERTLKNAIEHDKVSHAYLFCGPRGTGKTTTARLVAKALLCDNGPTASPDGACASCREIAAGEHPDVYELDAASRTGVENVREEIISRVQFAPTRGRFKVYIIDEVHMLSPAAFNALLKTLEEPPGHVVFILCTTDPQKIPETILSRCQRFDFRRISSDDITARLAYVCEAEGVSYEKPALEVITSRSDGGLRNALTALEQAIAFGNGAVTKDVIDQLGGTQAACDLTDIVAALAARDMAACFSWVETYAQTGGDFTRLATDLAQRVRDLYALTLAGAKAPLSVGDELRAEVATQAKAFLPDRLAFMLDTLGACLLQLKQATNARLCFEIALTKLCRPESELTLESLAARIEALEKRPAPTYAPASVAEPVATSMPEPEPAPAPEPARAAEPVRVPEPAPASVRAAEPAPEPAPVRVSAVQTAVADAPKPAATEVEATSAPSRANTKKLEGLENPAAVGRLWKGVLADVKRERQAYSLLLANAHASFDAQRQALVVSFSASSSYMMNTIKKPEAMGYLQQAVERTLGTALAVIVEGAGSSENSVSLPVVSSQPVQEQPPVAKTEQEAVREPLPAAEKKQVAVQEEPPAEVDARTSATPGWNEHGETAADQAYDYEMVPIDAYDDFSQAYDVPDDYAAEASYYNEASQEDAPLAPSPVQTPSHDEVLSEARPTDYDPFAIPEDDEPVMELDEFQSMLSSTFGMDVTAQEV